MNAIMNQLVYHNIWDEARREARRGREGAKERRSAKLVEDGLGVENINGEETKQYSRPAKHAGDEHAQAVA